MGVIEANARERHIARLYLGRVLDPVRPRVKGMEKKKKNGFPCQKPDKRGSRWLKNNLEQEEDEKLIKFKEPQEREQSIIPPEPSAERAKEARTD